MLRQLSVSYPISSSLVTVVLLLFSTCISAEGSTTKSDQTATTLTPKQKLEAQKKAFQHLKSMMKGPAVEEDEEVKQAEKNPYEQLVKLAFRGKGTDGVKSYQDAAKLYCKQARDDNDSNAQFALGWMYANGRGLKKDEHVAALFYKMAADQGHAPAKRRLANFSGDATMATLPECMQPDPLPEPIVAEPELAPAGSSGNPFYERGPIFEIVDRLSTEYHVETDFAMAIIKVESNFNPRARSPKNAQGLMQLIPQTAARFNVTDPYDPEDNIRGGMAYLQWLLAYYEGDIRLVAAAYNAGENAVDRYKGIPPYPETRRYVSKIYNLYRKSYHPFKQDLLIGERSEIIRLSSHP